MLIFVVANTAIIMAMFLSFQTHLGAGRWQCILCSIRAAEAEVEQYNFPRVWRFGIEWMGSGAADFQKPALPFRLACFRMLVIWERPIHLMKGWGHRDASTLPTFTMLRPFLPVSDAKTWWGVESPNQTEPRDLSSGESGFLWLCVGDWLGWGKFLMHGLVK